MNTKPSKFTLKKQDLPRRNFPTQSQARISRELSFSRLLYFDFPKDSQEILMEFFKNAEINLQPAYRPLPFNKNRKGGGVCTQAINLRLQKRIALLTLPVKNNLYTCNLSLGEYCNIPIFLSFLGSLLKQCILFGIVLQFSFPPPYTKLKGKKSE